MFPNHKKGKSSLGYGWLMTSVSLAVMLVVSAVFAFSSAQAQTPTGDYCIEGIVIDWEEKPLAGWDVTVTDGDTINLTETSAAEPDDDDDDPDFEKGEFKFKEGDLYDNGATEQIFTAQIESRDGWEGVTPISLTVPIEYGMDDCAQIRFKMRQFYRVRVYKIDSNHVGLNHWNILAKPGKGNLFAVPDAEDTGVTDGITGTVVFTLTPGLWDFSEYPPDADDDPYNDDKSAPYMPVVPPTGKQTLEIDRHAPFDTEYAVIFKNEFKNNACIRIIKESVPAPVEEVEVLTLRQVVVEVDPQNGQFPIGGWGFRLLQKDGTVVRQGVTQADGTIEFKYLPYGPYIIQEEDRAGWNEVTARELELNVDTGDSCYEVNFENYQDDSGYCIEGYKRDANGDYGIAGWKIKTEPLDDEGYDPADVFTNGVGKFRVDFPDNDYRVPGGLFEVCEDEVEGWNPHTPTCQIVRLPEWPGACVQVEDFINQQVGHSESEKYDKMDEKDIDDQGDYGLEYVKGKGYVVVRDEEAKMSGPYNNQGKDSYNGPYAKNEGKGMKNEGMKNDKACQTYHIVKKGETLFSIGDKYEATPQAMVDANPDTRKHKEFWVYEGQKICVP